jgi:hypothetical protein
MKVVLIVLKLIACHLNLVDWLWLRLRGYLRSWDCGLSRLRGFGRSFILFFRRLVLLWRRRLFNFGGDILSSFLLDNIFGRHFEYN